MRSAEILAALAIALTLASCTKRQSLYLEPGHAAGPPGPAEGGGVRPARPAAGPGLPRPEATP